MTTARDAIRTVLTRNAFYRDGYRLLLRVAIIEGIAIIILIGAIIGLILTADLRQVFFATTSDGRIINIVPLNEPFIAQGDLVAWAADTTKRVLQIGHHDYQMRLQDVAPNFTNRGWESFLKALRESRRLQAIRERRLIMDVEILAAPEVVRQGDLNGIYTWVLRVPISVKFEGDGAPPSVETELRMTAVRVSTLQSPRGVAIEQWIEIFPETLERLRQQEKAGELAPKKP